MLCSPSRPHSPCLREGKDNEAPEKQLRRRQRLQREEGRRERGRRGTERALERTFVQKQYRRLSNNSLKLLKISEGYAKCREELFASVVLHELEWCPTRDGASDPVGVLKRGAGLHLMFFDLPCVPSLLSPIDLAYYMIQSDGCGVVQKGVQPL